MSRPPEHYLRPGATLSAAELQTLSAGHCPDCRKRGFVIGPAGGMSLNIECAEPACRSRYNVTFMSGTAMMGHRNDSYQQGGPAWPSEPS